MIIKAYQSLVSKDIRIFLGWKRKQANLTLSVNTRHYSREYHSENQAGKLKWTIFK